MSSEVKIAAKTSDDFHQELKAASTMAEPLQLNADITTRRKVVKSQQRLKRKNIAPPLQELKNNATDAMSNTSMIALKRSNDLLFMAKNVDPT